MRTKKKDKIDVNSLIYHILRQWYWYTLFGILGFIGAFVFVKVTNDKFWMHTSILIQQNSKTIDIQNKVSTALDISKNKTINEIELIKSYSIINQALVKMNWRTTWYKKGMFVWNKIYKKEPFDIQEEKNFINPKGIAIYITPTSGNEYDIRINGKVFINNVETSIDINGNGTFGHPFKNKFFNFTLLKKINTIEFTDGQYYFFFNDLNDETISYQTRLNVELKNKAVNIIECTIVGTELQKECEFLNKLIYVYIQSKKNVQIEALRRSLNFINAQLKVISDSVKIANTKFTNFKFQNKIIDPREERKVAMHNHKVVEDEMSRSLMQLSYYENLQTYLNNNDYKLIISPSVVGIQDASLNRMVLKLSKLYNRRQIISFSAKENNPIFIMIDKELNQTRTQLNENLKNHIDNVTIKIKSQRDRQNNISEQMNKLPEKEQQMAVIQRNFDLNNEIYNFLLRKRAETNLALASNTSNVQIIDKARTDNSIIIGLPHKLLGILGLFFGFFFPIAFVLVRNLSDGRIHSQDDVEDHTKLPILGSILHYSTKSDLAVFENPKTNFAESFRSIRTNIQFMLKGFGCKVISIHSSNSSEGKSFIALNLGTILAMNNKKVLIIGADIRKPAIQKRFNQSNEHGLSSYLIGDSSIEQIIFPTPVDNLFLLPSGPIPPNPTELLSKPEMETLIEHVRKQYDYIIIDNAPVALVTDGIIISRLSDLNIFILRFGISHKHQLELINQMAASKKVNNIGIIVNDIRANSFGYGYYKYYQYEAYKKTYYADEESGNRSRRKNKENA